MADSGQTDPPPRSARGRIARRPQLLTGDHAPDERHASWLELFFDLVFVVAIAELGNSLSHDHSATGTLHFLVLFTAFWIVWIEYTFYADRFETDDALFRVMTGAVMLSILIASTNVHNAFSGNADGFALAFVAMQVCVLALYAFAFVTLPIARTLAARYIAGFGLGALFWLVSIGFDDPINYALWGAGIVVAVATPLLSVRVIVDTPVHAAHMAERFGLFTMIVLGESILAVAVGTSKTDWGFEVALVGALGFLCAGCLWWIYFDFVDGEAAVSRSALMRLLYVNAHLPLLAGLTAFGIGVKLAILGAGLPELEASVRWALSGGAAAFLLAQSLMHLTDGKSFDDLAVRARALAAAVLLLIAVTATGLSAVAFLSLILGVLIVELVIEVIDEAVHAREAA